MENNVLFKTHQHFIVFIFKVLKIGLIPALAIGTIMFFLVNLPIAFITFLLIIIVVSTYIYYFKSQSYFYITNDKLSMDVRNGLFSKYNMSIHFNQIKDMAYSKNHLFHYMFDYGVLFIRSSAGNDGNFIVPDIPHIEEVYKKVNYMYTLTQEERKRIISLNNDGDLSYKKKENNESLEEKLNNIRTTLLNIEGIKEVEILTNEDKKYIFENEEDKNHGVYECIKRRVTFVITHDSRFREADAPIVLKLGNKVIFPPVSFHEIKEKNTISSSPGLEVHNYLSKKFKNLDQYDATILVGFDL